VFEEGTALCGAADDVDEQVDADAGQRCLDPFEDFAVEPSRDVCGDDADAAR
jgi:hypothetical protein